MRLVLRTTNKNVMPEKVFSGKNEDFKKEMFKIINGYTQINYKIKWLNESIILKKDGEVICFYIFDYQGKAPSSLKKEYISKIF